MVEDVLQNLDNSITSIADLKRKLPKQVNHYTLKIILDYLEKSNKIITTIHGISWIHNPNKKLQNAINEGFEL